jgi:hypothetical protein
MVPPFQKGKPLVPRGSYTQSCLTLSTPAPFCDVLLNSNQLQYSFPDNTFQEHRYTMAATTEKFVGADITDEIVTQAANLFSLHYGVWNSIAKEKMGVHEGKTSPLLKSYH